VRSPSGVDDAGEDDSGVCPSQPKSSLSDLRISGVPSKTKKPRLEDLQAGLFLERQSLRELTRSPPEISF